MKKYFTTENLYLALVVISLFALLFTILTVINQFKQIF